MSIRVWLTNLRLKGPISPQQYTGIVKKMKTKADLLALVDDYDTHVSSPHPFFLQTAAKVATTISNCPSIIPAQLIDRIPKDDSYEATRWVAALVLAKAASDTNPVAARLVFSRISQPGIIEWTNYLRAIENDDAAFQVAVRDMLSVLPCPTDDPKFASSILKKVSSSKDLGLIEHVWKWIYPQRAHQLQHDSPDNHIALLYLQYIRVMSRMGFLQNALLAWNEWQHSTLGSTEVAQYSDILRSAMIAAVATHGDAKTAEEIYSSRPPTSVTTPGTPTLDMMLVSLLTAYSHAGRPDRAVALLQEAESRGPVSVILYNTVIDACARVGDFAQAQAIIARMREKAVLPDAVTWTTILGPCRSHHNLPVAEVAFEHLLKSGNPEDQAVAFVLLADVYRAVGKSDEAKKLHDRRLGLRLYKLRGAVNVTADGQVYKFHVGAIPEEAADMAPAINAKLDEWARVLSANGVSTESIMCRHSEKLALAFAVLKGQQDIVLEKNLRICSACHQASCALTIIEGIVIRHKDQSRIHIMRDGKCSCQGRY